MYQSVIEHHVSSFETYICLTNLLSNVYWSFSSFTFLFVSVLSLVHNFSTDLSTPLPLQSVLFSPPFLFSHPSSSYYGSLPCLNLCSLSLRVCILFVILPQIISLLLTYSLHAHHSVSTDPVLLIAPSYFAVLLLLTKIHISLYHHSLSHPPLSLPASDQIKHISDPPTKT